MNTARIVALVLITCGLLSLVYGGFTYTRITREAKVGSLEFSWKDDETVEIPVWLGVGGVVVGSALLFGVSNRKRG